MIIAQSGYFNAFQDLGLRIKTTLCHRLLFPSPWKVQKLFAASQTCSALERMDDAIIVDIGEGRVTKLYTICIMANLLFV